MDYIPTIGIEVHVELNTNTKIFSPSPNTYGKVLIQRLMRLI